MSKKPKSPPVEEPVEDDEEDDGIVVMIDDEGQEIELGLLGSVDVDDRTYAVLARVEQLESEEDDPLEIVLLRWTTSDEGETFESIDDDDEHARVEAAAGEFLVREGFVEEE